MQEKASDKRSCLKGFIIILLFCIVIDIISSGIMINHFREINIDKVKLLENKSNLKDFTLDEGESLLAESSDPWVYYPFSNKINVKNVKVIVDSVSVQDTWAELHFILEDGSWEHQPFFIHDGKNAIKINGFRGLDHVKDIRFDFVNMEGASVRVDNVIINDSYTLILEYQILYFLFIICTIVGYFIYKIQLIELLISRFQIYNIKNILLERWTAIHRPFVALVFMYLIGISAILRANFNYIDDMGRVAEGYKEWDNFSRYVSYYLSSIIHADNYLTDVSPLPQIIAVVFLAFSGVVILCVISEQRQFTLGNLIAVIPLALSPYFLECISYKYDSPYMALAILASVCPLLCYKYKVCTYLLVSILGILVTCTTYQAFLGVYPMLVMLICMRKWNKGESVKKVLQLLIVSFVGYVLGLVIFRVFIMHPIDSYVSTSIIPLNQLVPVTVDHMRTYYSMIQNDFKEGWLVLIVLIQIAFVILTVRESKRNRMFSVLITMLTLLAMSLSSFGIYPLLKETAFDPRSMCGFGIFITYLSVCISFESKAFGAKVASIALSWCFFVFAFTYGNALVVQSTYTDFRINMVINDLNDIETFSTEKEKTVQLSGSIGLSPVIKNMPQDYQILNRLIPVTFRGSWDWGKYGFYNYYGLKNVSDDWRMVTDIQNYDLPIIKDTMYHTIRGSDDYILIELK